MTDILTGDERELVELIEDLICDPSPVVIHPQEVRGLLSIIDGLCRRLDNALKPFRVGDRVRNKVYGSKGTVVAWYAPNSLKIRSDDLGIEGEWSDGCLWEKIADAPQPPVQTEPTTSSENDKSERDAPAAPAPEQLPYRPSDPSEAAMWPRLLIAERESPIISIRNVDTGVEATILLDEIKDNCWWGYLAKEGHRGARRYWHQEVWKVVQPGSPPDPTPAQPQPKAAALTKHDRQLLQRMVDGWKLKPRIFSRHYILVENDSHHLNVTANRIESLRERGLLDLRGVTDLGRAALAAAKGGKS